MTKNMKTWCSIHSIVSAFFLPIALIYMITGAMHVIGASVESHGRERHGVRQTVSRGAEANHPQEFDRDDATPERREKPDIKKAGILDKLMILHLAKGGAPFNIMGIAFAVSMILTYISGVLIGLSMPRQRKQILISAAMGLIATIVVIMVSS